MQVDTAAVLTMKEFQDMLSFLMLQKPIEGNEMIDLRPSGMDKTPEVRT